MSQADRCERAFNRIGRADVAPVSCREMVIGQQAFTVCGQAIGRLVILVLEGLNEQIKRLVSLSPRGGLPGLVQHLCGCTLFGSLFSTLAVMRTTLRCSSVSGNIFTAPPEAQRSIPDRQL